ncbi:MAG: hypothetical protein RLY43_839 [Bacteroidota bacterium]|jgi:hypothetical protein
MKIINPLGEVLENVYVTSDSWYEDINHFINAEFEFSVREDSPIDLMDKVCAHILHWYFESLNGDNHAKEIYEEHVLKNKILQWLIQDNNPIPEQVIYEFNGVSIYDELNGSQIFSYKNLESFKFDLKEIGQFIISRKEFDEMGGEIYFSEDEIEIEFYSSSVYFFMTESDLKSLCEYMLLCILELNAIYESLSLNTIHFKSKKIRTKRIFVEITESWGDGGACSTIKISRRQWTKILNGEKFEISAKSFYEGEKSIVDWCFEDGKLSITGEDWTCLIDEMHVEDLNPVLIE